jgi:hypothetical protein
VRAERPVEKTGFVKGVVLREQRAQIGGQHLVLALDERQPAGPLLRRQIERVVEIRTHRAPAFRAQGRHRVLDRCSAPAPGFKLSIW